MSVAEALLDEWASQLSTRLGVDGPGLMRERADILSIAPAGTTSAGGTCRLLPSVDGEWVAINLARRDDVGSLAAWMGHEWEGAPWDAVASALETMPGADAVERAQLLGIPAALSKEPQRLRDPVVATRGARRRTPDVVIDLSNLWAGPLCTRVLAEQGMRVVKVEHAVRPDGARAGPPEFWHRLNGDKEQVMLDFTSADGRARLDRLLGDAAVVVTSARPRALEQLDLGLGERVRDRGLTWVSITGYGLDSNRVAFGDDAAVAGGLAFVAGGRTAPVFVGDAPADPLAGLQAAHEAMGTMDGDFGAILDVSMRDVIAHALTPLTTSALVGGK